MAEKKKPAEESNSPDEQIAEEEAQGGAGDFVDPTPNEAYTVGGQAKGMATPETDADAAEKAKAATKRP